jgi:hypothetical protein
MAKKLQVDVDADSVINSFRPDIPSAPIPEPPAPVAVRTEQADESEYSKPSLSKAKDVSRDKKNGIEHEYMELFIREAGFAARSGKLVYLRKDYHDRILRIIQVIGKNQLSLFSYIDNVLTQHFADYEDEIKKIYKKNYEEVF